ncbi:MAG TPA: hypothetical protein VK558_00440 [Patescibacteria group bacterium]|nr:hypothetical protein [Patescibacteria group bacterium]
MDLRFPRILERVFGKGGDGVRLGGGTRFVLIIGDDGAVMAQFRRGAVADAWFVAIDEMDEGLESLRGYLNADKSAPLLVLADVLEQMYREENLPKVGPLDELKVLRRRLDMTFPTEQMKAALRQRARDVKGSTVAFLMAALPTSPVMLRWIEFLESLANPVTGFCLLPLESVDLAKALAPAAPADEDPNRCWHALISVEVTGGFRQIFVNNGRLVVTRLTQRPPEDTTADVVAQLVERELRSSISYIKRLGYVEGSRLDIVMVAGSELCEAMAQREIPATTVSLLTPAEAGRKIKLDKVGPEGSPYGDLLHAAWATGKKKPTLVMPTAAIGKRLLFDKLTYFGGIAAIALTLLTLWVVFDSGSTYYQQFTDLAGLEAQASTVNRQLAAERRKVAAFPHPVVEMKAVGKVGGAWQRRTVDLTTLLLPLQASLSDDVRVVKLAYADLATKPDSAGPASGMAAPRGQVAKPKPIDEKLTFELTVTVELGAGSSLEQSVARAKDLQDRLKVAYPRYKVEITTMPANILDNQVMEGNLDKVDPKGANLNKNTAVFTIRKEA